MSIVGPIGRRVLLVLPLMGCTRAVVDPRGPAPSTLVFASFQPLADWASRLGGRTLEVQLVCPEDSDPAECRPDAAKARAMQSAALVLVNGAGLEKWLDQVSLRSAAVVDTSAGFRDELLDYETPMEHQHGPLGQKHAHEGMDAHTWLDPNLAKKQVEALVTRFSATWPEQAASFRERGQGLVADLEKLHRRHTDLLARLGVPRLLASHPAYNYLARRYGWQITNLAIDPESRLDSAALEALAQDTRLGRSAIILFESSPLPALEQDLSKALGLVSVVFSPAEQASPEGDYFAIMNRNLDRLEAALSRQRSQE